MLVVAINHIFYCQFVNRLHHFKKKRPSVTFSVAFNSLWTDLYVKQKSKEHALNAYPTAFFL